MKLLLISRFVLIVEKWVHINKRSNDVDLVAKPEVCNQDLELSGFDAEGRTNRVVKLSLHLRPCVKEPPYQRKAPHLRVKLIEIHKMSPQRSLLARPCVE